MWNLYHCLSLIGSNTFFKKCKAAKAGSYWERGITPFSLWWTEYVLKAAPNLLPHTGGVVVENNMWFFYFFPPAGKVLSLTAAKFILQKRQQSSEAKQQH